MSFFGKTEVGNLERIALFAVICWLPTILIAGIFVNITLNLVSFYSWEQFNVDGLGTDPLIDSFRLSVLVSFLITGATVVYRRITIGLVVILVPLFFLGYALITFAERWSYHHTSNPEVVDKVVFSWSDFVTHVLTPGLVPVDYVFLVTIVIVAIWLTKILLIRNRRRTSEVVA